VPVFSAAVVAVGLLLEVCLAVAIVRNHLWRSYPYFSFFVCVFVTKALLLALFPPNSYPRFYWALDEIDVTMRFLIICELGRCLFANKAVVRICFSKGFTIPILTFVIFSVSLFWSYHVYLKSRSFWIPLERSSTFVQATATLAMVFASNYYGIRLGRQLKIIVMSFGAWASVSTLNNALLDFDWSFLPYWQIVRPLTFILLISAWAWTLWIDAPEQKIVGSPSALDMQAWNHEWEKAQLSLRRIKQL
jgi:hypothetical protein